MDHLFDFGISQEDAITEFKALSLKDNDRVLCIASSGDIPLNLLSLANVKINAVDISPNQIFLTKLKLKSVLNLEPSEAAGLIGLTSLPEEKRILFFNKVKEIMDEDEKKFWGENITAILKGPVNVARFEKYISKYNQLALSVIGKRKLLHLFTIDNIDEQCEYFDKKISSVLIKFLFKVAFHPRLYKNKGISSDGFKNSGERNIADFFYNKFRDFCTSTISRKNYFLQFTFFNKILFPEAFPEYLSAKGVEAIRKNVENLCLNQIDYFDVLKNCERAEFNKFHVSNIGDWVSKEDFSSLLYLIKNKAGASGNISCRYIHYKHAIPDDLKNYLNPDYSLGEQLMKTDRYPFYTLIPISIINAV